MKQGKISIENNEVFIPDNVRMKPYEIAELFGVYTRTIDSLIKTILKSGIVCINTTESMTTSGHMFLPDSHELDMITAIAFRIQSPEAGIFRNWVLRKLSEKPDRSPFVIRLPGNMDAN